MSVTSTKWLLISSDENGYSSRLDNFRNWNYSYNCLLFISRGGLGGSNFIRINVFINLPRQTSALSIFILCSQDRMLGLKTIKIYASTVKNACVHSVTNICGHIITNICGHTRINTCKLILTKACEHTGTNVCRLSMIKYCEEKVNIGTQRQRIGRQTAKRLCGKSMLTRSLMTIINHKSVVDFKQSKFRRKVF